MCVDDVRASGSNPSLLGEESLGDKNPSENSDIKEVWRSGKQKRGDEGRWRAPGVKDATIASLDGCAVLLIDRPAGGPASQTHRCGD